MTQVQDEEVAARADETLETQRRRQLMAAAMACVAEVGVARTTMRMIADRAGVTTGMVLYYFRSKKELISAAIAAANEAFSARMNLLTDGAFGPRRLEAILETFLGDPSEGVPRNFTVQYRSASLNDAELRLGSLSEYQAAREKLARSIRSGQEQGELRADVDHMLAADLILVLMQGLAMEESLSPEIISRDRALQIGFLALGFLKSAPASPAAQAQRPVPAARPETARSPATTVETIEAALVADPDLAPDTALELAGAISTLYSIISRSRPSP
jgi:AcrR family transcriptional regulator